MTSVCNLYALYFSSFVTVTEYWAQKRSTYRAAPAAALPFCRSAVLPTKLQSADSTHPQLTFGCLKAELVQSFEIFNMVAPATLTLLTSYVRFSVIC